MKKRWIALVLGLILITGCQDRRSAIGGPRPAIEFYLVARDASAPGIVHVPVRGTGERAALEAEALLVSEDVVRAEMISRSRKTLLAPNAADASEVRLTLTDSAGRRLEEFTARHDGESLAVVVNGEVISRPRIMGPLRGCSVVIAGPFTAAEAESLSREFTPH